MSQIYKTSTGGSGTGNVVGPVSAMDNVFVLFDGITGKLIKQSAFIQTLIAGVEPAISSISGNEVSVYTINPSTTLDSPIFEMAMTSIGVPDIGFGGSFIIGLENSIGSIVNGLIQHVIYLDPTAGVESTELSFDILNIGSAFTCFSISGQLCTINVPLKTNSGRLVDVNIEGSILLDQSDHYIGIQTTASARTVILPANPQDGQLYVIFDVELNALSNNITVDGNGHNILSNISAATYTINMDGASIEIVFVGSGLDIWKITGSYL